MSKRPNLQGAAMAESAYGTGLEVVHVRGSQRKQCACSLPGFLGELVVRVAASQDVLHADDLCVHTARTVREASKRLFDFGTELLLHFGCLQAVRSSRGARHLQAHRAQALSSVENGRMGTLDATADAASLRAHLASLNETRPCRGTPAYLLPTAAASQVPGPAQVQHLTDKRMCRRTL